MLIPRWEAWEPDSKSRRWIVVNMDKEEYMEFPAPMADIFWRPSTRRDLQSIVTLLIRPSSTTTPRFPKKYELNCLGVNAVGNLLLFRT